MSVSRAVKRDMTGLVRAGVALAVLGALGWLGSCSDGSIEPIIPTQGTGIISDPTSGPQTCVPSEGGLASAPASDAGENVSYVSLAPGTRPAGRTGIIRRVDEVASIFTTLFDGGFDPVPVSAQSGDSIEVRVTDINGTTLLQERYAVGVRRPPMVVRTDPARGKTDVAVNAAIVIVFSEPVACATLGPSSVQLFRGTTPVQGTVRLLGGTGVAIAFVPAAPLEANTEYELVVTRAVRDLEGDALAAGVTVTFTTGQSSTGPAVSLTLSPDTVYLTGATYQLTATVRDVAGNELIDQPVTWSSSDPSGLTVSPTGLLTALAAGSYYVDATVNGVQVPGRAQVYVSAGPAASVTFSPTSAAVGAAGDTIKLTATVRDMAGRLLDHPSIRWSSSDLAVATVAADSSSILGRAFATVTGVSPGSVTITATSGTASGTAAVTVVPPPPVGSVTVTPDSAWLLVQGRVQLSATVRDANGKALGGRAVTWTSDNAAVATVDATGLVTGVSVGGAAVIATSEGLSDAVAVTVRSTVSPVLAFTRWIGRGEDIYVTDGRVEANLTNSAYPDDYRNPVWSPDGGKIAFVSDRRHYPVYDVYVMNADGSALTKLTNYDGADSGISVLVFPAWSPDGQKIAFAYWRLGNGEISVMNADGSAQVNVTNNAGNDGGPVWSPDGQRIAFASDREGNSEIYVMNADGTGQTRLTNNAASDGGPVWSPDGQKIAFVSDRDGNYEIYVMKADGTAQTRLTNGCCYIGSPVWSPDGQKIAFVSNLGNYEIHVVNVDGRAQINLTNNAANDSDPAWSPDGQKIAFVSDRDGAGPRHVYVMNADGTTPIRITNNPASDERPVWRP